MSKTRQTQTAAKLAVLAHLMNNPMVVFRKVDLNSGIVTVSVAHKGVKATKTTKAVNAGRRNVKLNLNTVAADVVKMQKRMAGIEAEPAVQNVLRNMGGPLDAPTPKAIPVKAAKPKQMVRKAAKNGPIMGRKAPMVKRSSARKTTQRRPAPAARIPTPLI